jgi:hypothetical protein
MFGDGILGDGMFGDGILGDGLFGEGMLGDGFKGDSLDGLLGDGFEGDGSGMLDEGGFGISLGRFGIVVGGTLRRFSKDSHTSFQVKSHSTWYDVYPVQETTLAHFAKKD